MLALVSQRCSDNLAFLNDIILERNFPLHFSPVRASRWNGIINIRNGKRMLPTNINGIQISVEFKLTNGERAFLSRYLSNGVKIICQGALKANPL